MAIILQNNDDGFVIRTESEEQYYAKPPHLQGTCIMQNSIRIGEFWRKGWTDCELVASLIKRIGDGVMLMHLNIFNPKLNKIIDVSNGFVKMVDVATWRQHNTIIRSFNINYNNVKSVITISDKEMIHLRGEVNMVFRRLLDENYNSAD